MADVSSLLEGLILGGISNFSQAQESFVELLRDAAPERDGTLKDSFETTFGGGEIISGTIYNTAEYASFTDEGTDPHPIFGVGKPLAFEIGGMDVVVWSVEHPGTTGTGWWTDNMTDEQWASLLQEQYDANGGFY